MASENLIKIAMKLAKQLGANESKYIGKRTNVSFLGTGPQEGKLFQQDINPEVLGNIELKTVLPQIETSMSYMSNGKLNDIQANKLIDNLSKMNDFYYPITGDSIANVTDLATRTGNLTSGGLESLRGLGLKNLDNVSESSSFIGKMKKQFTDAARNKTENMPGRDNPNFDLLQKSLRDSEDGVTAAKIVERRGGTLEEQKALFEKLRLTNLKQPSSVKLVDEVESPLMSRLEDRVKNIETQTNDATAIMETIPKNEVPGKTASAREFLLNALKEGDEVGRTTFADTIDPRDLKFLTEGGGGVDGDPIVLVQKYFGPRVAELLPSNATVDDIAIFTQRILNDATDAKGLRPTDPEFDKFTLKFADGGRAGYLRGGAAQDMGNLENQKASANAVGGAIGDFSNEAQNFNHRYRDQLNNNNNNNDTVGITSVIAAPPAITTVDRVRDGTISVDEEDEDKMTTAANAITNFENFNNQNQKKADIAAAFARQELFAKGGLAKILEI